MYVVETDLPLSQDDPKFDAGRLEDLAGAARSYLMEHSDYEFIELVPVGFMPRDPKGEKRPADVIGNAVRVMKIATGEIEETPEPRSAAAELGSKGGKARAERMSPERRAEIARKAAEKRWRR